MEKRNLIQLISALIYNANLPGFIKGRIYTEHPKGLCVPGLNCYSCPGAIGSCPLGTLQNNLQSVPDAAVFYVIGILLLLGLLFGRLICGFLCPFGWLQELLHKIPSPKAKKNRLTKKLSYLKYMILVLFVASMPAIVNAPAFCQYICPAGTLFGGIPLVFANETLQSVIGVLFQWKVLLAIVILLLAIFVYRGFCRFICPLGAIYSLFNRISVLGVRVEQGMCSGCGRCNAVCPTDSKRPGDRECVGCGKCIAACRENAVVWKKIRKKGT